MVNEEMNEKYPFRKTALISTRTPCGMCANHLNRMPLRNLIGENCMRLQVGMIVEMVEGLHDGWTIEGSLQ